MGREEENEGGGGQDGEEKGQEGEEKGQEGEEKGQEGEEKGQEGEGGVRCHPLSSSLSGHATRP